MSKYPASRVRGINSPRQSSAGSAIAEGAVMITLFTIVSLAMVVLIVNVSMCGTLKERLCFITTQVANYAVTLDPNSQEFPDEVTNFTKDLFKRMGLSYNGPTPIIPETTSVGDQRAVSVKITNSFPLIASPAFEGWSVKISDSATATAVGRIPTLE